MACEIPVGSPVWLACGWGELPGNDDWLAPEEAARAASMSFTKRRSEYLLRRWVCKQAVAVALALPDDLRSLARILVANRPSGAPVVTVDGVEAGVEVSLSDRAGWAVCVIAGARGKVGCDLEIVEPRSPGFVATFLTMAEQAYVAAQPVAERDEAATLIWSAKESGLKVLQTGLRRDTRGVAVIVRAPDGAAGWARLAVRTEEGAVLPGWWRRAGSFLVTVVADTPFAAPQRLSGSADLESAAPVHAWVDRPRSL